MNISRHEITVELVLHIVSTVLVKNKTYMHTRGNTNCVVLVILYELNVLIVALKTRIAEYKDE